MTNPPDRPSSQWVPGDTFGLEFPASSSALREAGAPFLTTAFRTCGTLAADNRIVAITQFEELFVGGTGRKVLLSVAYEKPAPHLHTELFVKLSRDFDDPVRDVSKDMMDSETRLALLSMRPGFPVVVPACCYADYHRASGTGILITQRIAFGRDGIEPLYDKCLDYEIRAPLEHYEALIKAVARLAGAHKAGRLGADIDTQFPYDAQSDFIPYNAPHLQKKLERVARFARSFPQLLPDDLRCERFLAQFARDGQRYLTHERTIRSFLASQPDFIALCHFNANIDNGWFWRNDKGEMECGLLDWGRVSQMHFAQAIFGSLCASEAPFWERHRDELLAVFVAEYRRAGGPSLDLALFKFQVQLFTALLGLAWIMDAPALIERQVPALAAVESRFDPRLKSDALARIQLQLLTVFLHSWRTEALGDVLDRFLGMHADARSAGVS